MRTLQTVRVPVPLCRVAYRGAYAALTAYRFLRRPDIQGVKCVLTDGDRVLLVRHTYGHRAWDLPGGAVRRSEPPEQAASREMHEELGVHIDDWRSIGQIRGHIDHRNDTMYCFHTELGPQALTLDRCELETAQWFPRAELPRDLGRFVTEILDLARA
jgi:8-oxo-dGTP pyrophosphatase MutT (NUDIX family)